MPECNPLTDPQPGDAVCGRVGDNYVTRTVITRRGCHVDYDDSRKTNEQTCWISSWQEWCRKTKAQTVKDQS